MTPAAPTTLQEDFRLLNPPGTAAEGAAASHGHLALVVMMIILASALFWWRARRRARQEMLAGLPPDEIALHELARWESLAVEAGCREAVAEISGTLRRYAEARFGLHAPTLTTEEFWHEQHARRQIPGAYEDFWDEFMATCDMTKYMGHTPSLEQVLGLLHSCRKFLHESRAGSVAVATAGKS